MAGSTHVHIHQTLISILGTLVYWKLYMVREEESEAAAVQAASLKRESGYTKTMTPGSRRSLGSNTALHTRLYALAS